MAGAGPASGCTRPPASCCRYPAWYTTNERKGTPLCICKIWPHYLCVYVKHARPKATAVSAGSDVTPTTLMVCLHSCSSHQAIASSSDQVSASHSSARALTIAKCTRFSLTGVPFLSFTDMSFLQASARAALCIHTGHLKPARLYFGSRHCTRSSGKQDCSRTRPCVALNVDIWLAIACLDMSHKQSEAQSAGALQTGMLSRDRDLRICRRGVHRVKYRIHLDGAPCPCVLPGWRLKWPNALPRPCVTARACTGHLPRVSRCWPWVHYHRRAAFMARSEIAPRPR
jgi:hypothetical protein